MVKTLEQVERKRPFESDDQYRCKNELGSSTDFYWSALRSERGFEAVFDHE